jgi:hypothetical protein
MPETSTTRWRLPFPRTSLHSLSSSKRRNGDSRHATGRPTQSHWRHFFGPLKSAGALEVEGFPLPLRPLAGLARNEELACAGREARSGRRLGQMSRRKSEITGHMNERDFRTLSSWSCRQEASAARALSLNRSTVNAASQFAEAAGGTRWSNSTSASAFQMAPPLTPLHAWAPGIIGKRRGDVVRPISL